MNRKLGVLIMAAGKGTRMKSAKPKVMQEILDQKIIDCVIHTVAKSQITEPENVAVLVGSGGEQVAEYLSSNYDSRIQILWQSEQLGTGHAVKSAQSWWQNFDDLIVLNGDLPLIKPESLREFFARSQGNDCTVITFVAGDPAAYGRIVRKNNHVSIVEFKEASDSEKQIHEVNGGCYAFKVKALEQVIDLITNNNAKGEYYITDALALMNQKGFVTGAFVMSEEEMKGVNDQFELSQASRILQARILRHWLDEGVHIMDTSSVFISPDAELESDVTIMPNVQIWGKSRIESGAIIGSGSILRNALIGRNVNLIAYAVIENSELKDSAKAGPFVYIRDNTCLERKAFAGKFVELKNSRIGENSKVPHLSYMGDATLGHDVNIGAGSITCNYDGVHKNKTFIGDNCFVGSDTMFVAPAKMSDNSATAAGSVITQEIPEDSLAVARARQKNISGWTARKKIISKS